jgi:hypothetical protein
VEFGEIGWTPRVLLGLKSRRSVKREKKLSTTTRRKLDFLGKKNKRRRRGWKGPIAAVSNPQMKT